LAAPGTFSPLEISIKLALAIAIGMLVGLEREWSQKDLGTRTFAITAMVGALSVLAGPAFAYVSFAGILLIVFLAGIRNVYDRKPVEATTSVAVILTFVLGVLVGEGHHYTPIAAVVIMTMLLSLKPALTHFAGGLQVNEVRSAVLLGLLAFVIFPVLPNRTVDPWQLINPREAWLTVIVIAALGFVNYVLLKLYSSRGLYYTAVLGGMINSTATIAELAEFLTSPISDLIPLAIVVDFLTIIAMFVRNLLYSCVLRSRRRSDRRRPASRYGAGSPFLYLAAKRTPPESDWRAEAVFSTLSAKGFEVRFDLPDHSDCGKFGPTVSGPFRLSAGELHWRPDIERQYRRRRGYPGDAGKHLARNCRHGNRSHFYGERAFKSSSGSSPGPGMGTHPQTGISVLRNHRPGSAHYAGRTLFSCVADCRILRYLP